MKDWSAMPIIGNEADDIVLRRRTIAYEGRHKAVEEALTEIAAKQVQRRMAAQAQGLRHDVQEQHRDEHASCEAGKIGAFLSAQSS
jgi:hypothetical protein